MTNSRQFLTRLGVDMQKAEIQAETIIIDLFNKETDATQLYVIAMAIAAAAEVEIVSAPGGSAAFVLLRRAMIEARTAALEDVV